MVPISYFAGLVKQHELQLTALLKVHNLVYKDVLAKLFRQLYTEIPPAIYKEVLYLDIIKTVLSQYANPSPTIVSSQETDDTPPKEAA